MSIKYDDGREAKIQKTIQDASNKVRKDYAPQSSMPFDKFVNKTTPGMGLGVPIDNGRKKNY